MQVDKRSLIDLGILPDASGAWPLIGLLDHTHSRAGLDALKGQLANPLGDATEIRRRQQLLRVLPTALMHVQWTPLVALCRDVDAFLDSNYVLFPDARVDAALFMVRHRDIVEYLETRLTAVSQLLEVCATIRDRLRGLEGDAAFTEIVTALSDTVDQPLRIALRRAESSGATRRLALCTLDRAVRTDAREALRHLLRMIHRLDAFASLAVAAARPGFTYPTVHAAQWSLLGVRHPLLERGVPNDVQVADEERVMFLTGPNMAGKSTLLRTIGIIVYFAHIGLPVPAADAQVPVVDRLISSLGIEDNIVRGESLYLAEVRRVKHVVTHVLRGERVVALLDEVFRGTNAKDAGDATGLMVDGLACVPAGLFVVASHLVEVAETRLGRPGIAWWCMQVGASVDGHAFTYGLARGISNVRLGMALLETEGVAGMLRELADTERPRAALVKHSCPS